MRLQNLVEMKVDFIRQQMEVSDCDVGSALRSADTCFLNSPHRPDRFGFELFEIPVSVLSSPRLAVKTRTRVGRRCA